MSIIFQLFSAEDLKQLNEGDLIQLRDTILNALRKTIPTEPAQPSDNTYSERQRNELQSIVSALYKVKQEIDKTNLLDFVVDLSNNPVNLSTYSDNDINDNLSILKQAIENVLGILDGPSGKLYLNLKEKVEFSSSLENLAQNKSALRKRFNEIVNQLNSTPKDFDYKNLINEEIYKEGSAKEIILRWAISCELNHIEFYEHLVKAKDAADKFFEERMAAKAGKSPEDLKKMDEREKVKFKPSKPSDSVYSPYNPRHPLYRQYSNTARSASETPKAGTPTDSSKTSGT